MAIGHWIGGALGFALGAGPLGIIAGVVLGGIVQDFFSQDGQRAATPEEERNDFLFSLLVLASYIIQADNRIMHSELEFMRRYLRNNFGEVAVGEGEEILRNLFQMRKDTIEREGRAAYTNLIHSSCQQMAGFMTHEQRLQLLSFLFEIAKADGEVHPAEIAALKEIAVTIGMTSAEVDSLLNMGGHSLEEAYKVLEISPEATDDEIRKAYRRLALKHHPDRVAALGEDIRKAAERKFQELGEAKERIYKARGMR